MASRPILQERIRSAFAPGDVSYFQPKWMCPRHFHGQIELCVVTRGDLDVCIGGECHRVAAPALVWLAPIVAHAVVRVSPDLRFWTVTFEPELLAAHRRIGVAREIGETLFTPWINGFVERIGDTPVFQTTRRDIWLLDQLCECGWLSQFSGGFEAALLALFDAAWNITGRELSGRGPCPLTGLGLGVILGGPTRRRERLCRELLVSSSYSARLFRRQLDATFVELRGRAQAVTFLALSRRPGASLTSCALEAGFGSYSQAHRILRAATGHSPSEYVNGGGREDLALSDYRAALTPWAMSVVEAARARRQQLQGAQAALVSEGMLT